MRFADSGCAAAGPAEEPSHQCRFEGRTFRHLGREVARTCCDPAYRSPYLTTTWMPGGPTAAGIDEVRPRPASLKVY
jgi:hypothetical protein